MRLQFNRPNFEQLQSEVEEQRRIIARLTAALTLSEADLVRVKETKAVKKNAAKS